MVHEQAWHERGCLTMQSLKARAQDDTSSIYVLQLKYHLLLVARTSCGATNGR